MVDDKLGTAVEEFDQGHFLAIFRGEGVVGGDFDDGESAALACEGVTLAGVFLLGLEEREPEGEILVRSDNL